MTVFISLLRGINVSGQKQVRMVELKALYEKLGFHAVQTYIQSGNVIFKSQVVSPSDLARQISSGVAQAWGFPVEVMVRSLDVWHEMIEANPFRSDRSKQSQHLHVTLLSEPPHEALLAPIRALETGADEYHIQGQVVYLYCPNGYGRTKLNNTFWEKKLKVSATTRNWNTVMKLRELADTV